MSKNVLYLTYDGLTDVIGRSQVIPYLLKLSTHGYSFFIISCEKKDRYAKYKDELQAIFDEAGIKWYPLTYTKNPPLLSTVFDIIRVRRTAVKLHKEFHFSLVHCRSYIVALIGLYFKRKKNVPFIFDTRGLWVDERVQGGLWNLKNPIYKFLFWFFKKLEKDYFENASCTITQAERAKEYMHTWKNLRNQPIPIKNIPCCADFVLFDPSKITEEDKDKARKGLGLQDETVVGYCGALGTWYMLKEKLDFFKKYLEFNTQAKFLFVTPHNREEIYTAAAQAGIDAAYIIVKEAKREEVPLYTSLFAFSVFFIKPGPSNIAKSPIKYGELMAMGIPVITNSGVGDIDDIIIQSHSGILIHSFDDKTYEKAIEELLKGNTAPPNVIREKAELIYSLDKGVNGYLEVYNELT
ncbi:MAG: glycosyltransferase family 4 protein [Chitinophagaceae bacterium]|nr:glycosyltransferase family 4 protein [Chitinophagaceae bacterium]